MIALRWLGMLAVLARQFAPSLPHDAERVVESSAGGRGVLVLADISGYTGFLQAVSDAHGAEMAAMPEPPAAYPLMTSLLDGIVERLTPRFVLSKFEGDAVFAYAPDDTIDFGGDALLDCLRECYGAYRERLDETEHQMLCSCEVCSRVHVLDLKFVVHAGHYVMQSIVGRQELLGPDVTMAHLLLKNNVTTRGGYALITEPATDKLGVPLAGSEPHVEHYDHYQPIRSYVFWL